ncbi:hypothetical protein KUCAC02_017069 [Chaenocephalus aceratus]|nr:hypothetical protein KUCAC02_017069 [Chaenocephalus aceratus]
MADEKRLSARRKHTLKGSMLLVATNLLDAESNVKVSEREKFLEEKVPSLELPYSRDELLGLVQTLHDQIDISEEERYSIEFQTEHGAQRGPRPQHKDCGSEGKVQETPSEESPNVCRRHVESSSGLKHTVNMDLRAGLKQVKKEDKQLRDAGDWRKNIEDKSDRKKMFDS